MSDASECQGSPSEEAGDPDPDPGPCPDPIGTPIEGADAQPAAGIARRTRKGRALPSMHRLPSISTALWLCLLTPILVAASSSGSPTQVPSHGESTLPLAIDVITPEALLLVALFCALLVSIIQRSLLAFSPARLLQRMGKYYARREDAETELGDLHNELGL